MPSRSNYLELNTVVSIAPQSVGGVVNGAAVDLSGAESALVVIDNGAATTPATIQIQEAPDNGSGAPGAWSAVADTDLIGLSGNAAGVAQAASSVVQVAYVGVQRWLRVVTSAGTAALLSAEVVRGHLRRSVPRPPV